MRPRFLLGEAWNGLRRSASMAISIMIVTAVSLFFFGVGLLAQRQVETAKGYWYDKVEVSIFLCTRNSSEPDLPRTPAVTQDQIRPIGADLEAMRPVVKEVTFESQDEAYKRFREQFTNPAFAGDPQGGDPRRVPGAAHRPRRTTTRCTRRSPAPPGSPRSRTSGPSWSRCSR